MIHDATGKFSLRWVFPDRRSLALVIRNWLHSSELAACADAWRMRGYREPHIGEYAAKTNAIWACQPLPSRPHSTQKWPSAELTDESRGLLPVVLENLVAGRTYLGTMFLEAGQDGEIALVDHRTAVLLDVAGT